MSTHRTVGIVLLGIGAMLLVLGTCLPVTGISDARITFSTRFSQASTSCYIGGIGAVLFGVVAMLIHGRRPRVCP